MEAARRAIDLDPASAVAHTALACATLLYENNRAMAKQEFERALDLNPTLRDGPLLVRALLFAIGPCGDFEQGIAEARRALDSDPLSAYVTMNLGVCLYTAGRLDEAIETCRRAIQARPGVVRGALGARHRAWGGWTIRRCGLHARRCRRDVGAPLARSHRPGLEFSGSGGSRRRRSPCIAN